MKKYKQVLLVLAISLFIIACNTGPKPIDYSNDGCHYCKMTIVDKIHGAEMVTSKGKVFKFDATECMLNYIQDNPDTATGDFFTNYYESPTALNPALETTFLISEAIPSPMGGYITAFKDKNNAARLQTEKGGTLYTWDELKLYLKK